MFFQLLRPDDARWSPPARRELTSTLDLRRPFRQTKVVTVNLGAFESQTHPPRRLYVAFSRGSGFSSVRVVVHDIEGVQGLHSTATRIYIRKLLVSLSTSSSLKMSTPLLAEGGWM